MRQFITKNISGGVMDVDKGSRSVKIAVASIGNIDLVGDVFASGAFTKTITERGPQGSNQIWHLADHNVSLRSAYGKPREIGIENDKLYFVSEYKDTPLWEATWPLYEAGDITEHSVGFAIVDYEMKPEYRIIKEAMLFEGSSVLWGANPKTPTMSIVKDAAGIAQTDDPLVMIEKMLKLLKSESNNELVHIGMMQLATKLQNQTTEPPASTQPDMLAEAKAAAIAINSFKNKLKFL